MNKLKLFNDTVIEKKIFFELKNFLLIENFIKENEWSRVTFYNKELSKEIILNYIINENKIDITILDISDRMRDFIKIKDYLQNKYPDESTYFENLFVINSLDFKNDLTIKLNKIYPYVNELMVKLFG